MTSTDRQGISERTIPRAGQAESKAETNANAAFDFFIETCRVNYDKAVAKLIKGRGALAAFYDFPTEHWTHIRTTNPNENSFATERHRTE